MEKLVITTCNTENNEKIFELFFNNLENAKNARTNIFQKLANKADEKWILLGPDDFDNLHGINADMLQSLTITIMQNCEKQEEKIVEKDLVDKIMKIVDDACKKYQIPFQVPTQPFREIAVATYMVAMPYDTWVTIEPPTIWMSTDNNRELK